MPSRSPSLLFLLAASFSVSGCFADRSGLGGRDGGPPRDGATPDAARDDGGREDAFVPPPDGGPVCAREDEGCAGTVRSYCEAGVLETEDCATENAHCVPTGGAGPSCAPNVCVPGTSRCAADRTAQIDCVDFGAREETVSCTRGCTSGSCRPQTPCSETVELTTSGGTYSIDLCGKGADQAHTSACSYDEQSPAGEDVLIRVEVDHRRPVRFQARQTSVGETIDPTSYLRRACADMSSEIWCREDTDGQDEDFTETLDPGDWFLVVDRHERGGTSCGTLQVTITPM